MRARTLLTGMLLAAACSSPGPEPVVESSEDPAVRDLALPPGEGVPIASAVEVHQPEPEPAPIASMPDPESEVEVVVPEVVAAVPDPEPPIVEPVAVLETPVESHVHPKADPDAAEHGPAVRGGGKPTGISEGLGPVPDRNWGDVGLMDEPNVIPNPITGRAGVLVRGGAPGIHDDCAAHRPPPVAMGGTENPGGALVNDRTPRRGAAINERAPRTRNGGSMPRGGGFGGGVRFR